MRKKHLLKVLPLFIVPIVLALTWNEAQAITPSFAKLGVPFIANKGQTNERVRFYAKTIGGAVYVTKDGEIVYSLQKVDETKTVKGLALKEELCGGIVKDIKGEGKSITKVSYFVGKNPSKWRSNIPTYDLVDLGEVYGRIELKLKAYGNNVEKLFSIKPGANPENIKVRIKGAKALKVSDSGGLEVETELGTVRFTKPVAYQLKTVDSQQSVVSSHVQNRSGILPDREKQFVDVAYVVEGNEYRFKVGDYDRTKELVIDPLLASTYLGGSSDDYANALAIDGEGNVYVTGTTLSTDFPTTPGAYDTTLNFYDAFVAKFNKNLTTLLALTYLGGSNGESANAIAINSSGKVYIAGKTLSTDFPTTSGAYDTTLNFYDAFVAKFSGDLTDLLASTYLGGSSSESATSILIGSDGSVYVGGETLSTNFPTTTGAFDATYNGSYDAYVSKFKGDLTDLLASTYLGGISNDSAYSIALDADGNLYVGGKTLSTNFPTTTGAFDTTYNGSYDAFVAKLNGKLTTLLASTYIGGGGNDIAYSIALDADGNLYVGGETLSTNFQTTPGAYDTTYSGSSDAFVSKFNKNLTTLLASTFLGSTGNDAARSIVLDLCGFAYVAGYTGSSDFPTTPGTYDASYNGGFDAFITTFKGDLTNILASTFLGGSGNDAFNAGSCFDKCFFVDLAIDSNRDVYVAGETNSFDFPTTSGAFDEIYNGSRDTFVSKLDLNPPSPQHILTVTKAGTGSGTVTSDPAGINCGTDCTETYTACPQVTLTASVVPGSGYYFVGWTGCNKVNPDGTCTVIMNRDKTVGATFNICSYSISPKSKSFPVSGGKGSISVTTQDLCPWTAEVDPLVDWISITSGSSGSGIGTVKYSVDSNPDITSSRTGNLTIAEKTFTVTQARAIVHLIQPNGGEVVHLPYTMQWEASAEATKFNLMLSLDNGLTWTPIANGVTDTSYLWTVPVPLGNKKACLVRVIGYSGSKIVGEDRSNAPFAIEVVKLDAPDGGENFPSGSDQTITWTTYTTRRPVAKVRLFFTLDGGATWNLIKTITGNPESFDWTVPAPWGNRRACFVRVILYDASNVELGKDGSDAPFTIEVVKLDTPNGGENFASGSHQTITWTTHTTKRPVAKVRLEYSKDGGATWNWITTIKGSNPGTYDWIVPKVLSEKTNSKARVILIDALGNILAADASDNPFAIQPSP